MSKKKSRLKKFLKKALGMVLLCRCNGFRCLRNRSAAENRIKGMIENDSFANARKAMTRLIQVLCVVTYTQMLS